MKVGKKYLLVNNLNGIVEQVKVIGIDKVSPVFSFICLIYSVVMAIIKTIVSEMNGSSSDHHDGPQMLCEKNLSIEWTLETTKGRGAKCYIKQIGSRRLISRMPAD